MKAKILIDSISLLSPLTGIGRYTYEIAKIIQKDESFHTEFFYGYYSKNLLTTDSPSEMKQLKSFLIKFPLIKKISRKLLKISSQIFSPQYELYWQPNFIPNNGIKAKKIVTTLHDFSFILHKEFHPKERIEYFENNFLKNIYKSDLIITGSEFSKKEILDRLNFEEEQVKVIYHGLNHKLFKVLVHCKVDFHLPEKFIFSVGSIEPRKNLIGLLKAYNMLPENIKDEYHLVLAGFKGWENSEIMELIKLNQKKIHYLGFISDEELVKTYNLASLFVYPSFYEGFGLPVLEAMACGTPVVCSDYSSLPEVGADAVVYCNPKDVENIKNKIEYVLLNQNLQKQMIEDGIARAQMFTWEKSAKEHSEIFKSLLK